jgi:hypothetical protein
MGNNYNWLGATKSPKIKTTKNASVLSGALAY